MQKIEVQNLLSSQKYDMKIRGDKITISCRNYKSSVAESYDFR